MTWTATAMSISISAHRGCGTNPGEPSRFNRGITLSGGGVPDRVVLADLDGDDDLDVVIGVEFASTLVWGENDGSGGTWTEHSIATTSTTSASMPGMSTATAISMSWAAPTRGSERSRSTRTTALARHG